MMLLTLGSSPPSSPHLHHLLLGLSSTFDTIAHTILMDTPLPRSIRHSFILSGWHPHQHPVVSKSYKWYHSLCLERIMAAPSCLQHGCPGPCTCLYLTTNSLLLGLANKSVHKLKLVLNSASSWSAPHQHGRPLAQVLFLQPTQPTPPSARLPAVEGSKPFSCWAAASGIHAVTSKPKTHLLKLAFSA